MQTFIFTVNKIIKLNFKENVKVDFKVDYNILYLYSARLHFLCLERLMGDVCVNLKCLESRFALWRVSNMLLLDLSLIFSFYHYLPFK